MNNLSCSLAPPPEFKVGFLKCGLCSWVGLAPQANHQGEGVPLKSEIYCGKNFIVYRKKARHCPCCGKVIEIGKMPEY